MNTHTAAEQVKRLKQIWIERNPTHEVNSDSGEDMFWPTILMVFDDYAASLSAPAPKTADELYKIFMSLPENERKAAWIQWVKERKLPITPAPQTEYPHLCKDCGARFKRVELCPACGSNNTEWEPAAAPVSQQAALDNGKKYDLKRRLHKLEIIYDKCSSRVPSELAFELSTFIHVAKRDFI
jgi:hypothetical protein